VNQVGTFNGNPLSMAAARATLDEVLTPEAYPHLEMIDNRLLTGCQAVIDRYGLPGYTVGIGSKGCVTFAPARITDYTTYRRYQDGELTDLAWLYSVNRDIFMTPGREEEWTLSVAHQPKDADASSQSSRSSPPTSPPDVEVTTCYKVRSKYVVPCTGLKRYASISTKPSERYSARAAAIDGRVSSRMRS
jgi:hypothetical protein